MLKQTVRRAGVVSFWDLAGGSNAFGGSGRRALFVVHRSPVLDHRHELADEVEVVEQLLPLFGGGVRSGLGHPLVDRLLAEFDQRLGR